MLAVSGTYTFVALGLLAGIWTTRYPAAASLVKRPTVWKSCACGGLLFAVLLDAVNLVSVLLPQVMDSAYLAETYGQMAGLMALVGAIGTHERGLAFVAAFACGATSVWFDDKSHAAVARPIARDAVVLCLVVAGTFLVGLLRPFAWGALLPSPLGILLLWGCLFEWSLCVARGGAVHGCLAALCTGELAYRVAGRFGLPSLPGGHGFDDLALIVSAACLIAGAVVSLRLRERGASDARNGKADATVPRTTVLTPGERERLESAGLTARELDVLAASVDGCDSYAAARHLGLQPSTVRTYKARICKKLGTDSFDWVLAEHSAQRGLFEPVHSEDPTCHAHQTHSDETPERRSRTSTFLCLSSCLSLLVLFLMPFGVLPAFWDAVWVTAFAVAAGILASCVPVCLRGMGLCRRPSFVGGGAATSAVFFFFTAACLAIRLYIELGGTGFAFFQQTVLFAALTGFVCFGLVEFRARAGSARLDAPVFGAACACVTVETVAASLSTYLWYGAVAISMVAFVVGSALEKPGNDEAEGVPDAHPVVAASWFVIAFIWEECWRGVTYVSLQDVGIPFLVVLLLLDALVICKQNSGSRLACAVVLVCAGLLCLEKGTAFGLLVGVVALEVQVVHARQSTACGEERKVAPLPPALLGAAVGCCVAVYASNTRGSYILLHADSAPLANVDWLTLCCFAASLAVVLWRASHHTCHVSAPAMPNVDQARLEGYLAGKGLTDTEVQVCVVLLHGASVAQVAEELSYSVSTVNMAKRSAFAKLGVATRYQYMASLWSEFGANPKNFS